MGVPVWQSYTWDPRAGESKDGRSAGWGPRKEELTAGQHILSGQCMSSSPREVTGGLGVISQGSENASSTTWGHSPLLRSNTKGWAEGAQGEGAQVGAGGLGLRRRKGGHLQWACADEARHLFSTEGQEEPWEEVPGRLVSWEGAQESHGAPSPQKTCGWCKKGGDTASVADV